MLTYLYLKKLKVESIKLKFNELNLLLILKNEDNNKHKQFFNLLKEDKKLKEKYFKIFFFLI
jgi:hypothetical protein